MLACVRCKFVEMMNYVRNYAKVPIWIPDHYVGIAANGNGAFPFLQTNQASWRGAEPLDCLINRKPACDRFRPYHRQAQLQRRNPSPRFHEIALLYQFQPWRASE